MRTTLRMRPRLAAALAATALTVLAATPAAAVTPDEVVGGPDLGLEGVVVADGAPEPPDVQAASWLVADLDSGAVLAAKDAHGRYAPASTLKTLTAVALIPELAPDLKVAATFDDVAVEGSKVGIKERVGYPVRELFSALLMVSGNDAANVLASAAGGQERTAELMNATARRLKAFDTNAVNPHGLDAEGQLSSAYDLALITRAGLAMPDFRAYSGLRSSSVSGPGTRIEIRNKNKLLFNYPGTIGGKNGFTSAARASYVGAAERDGRRLVVAVMRSVPKVFDEAASLLDWGFANAATVRPVGTLVAPEGVEPAAQAEVPDEPVTEAAATQVEDGPSVAVALAGTALAAAAVVVVRPRAGSRPPARRPVPAQRRPVPARPVARRR